MKNFTCCFPEKLPILAKRLPGTATQTQFFKQSKEGRGILANQVLSPQLWSEVSEAQRPHPLLLASRFLDFRIVIIVKMWWKKTKEKQKCILYAFHYIPICI